MCVCERTSYLSQSVISNRMKACIMIKNIFVHILTIYRSAILFLRHLHIILKNISYHIDFRKLFKHIAYHKASFTPLSSLTTPTIGVTCLLLCAVSEHEGFLLGLSQSPADSVERITSWFHYFLWMFFLGIAQLSKYSCHMLILFGSGWHSGEHSHVSGLRLS